MKADSCDYSGIQFNQNPSAVCMGYLDEFNELMKDIDIYNVYYGVDGTPANGGSGKCSAKENEIYKQAMKFGLEEKMERRPFVPHTFTGEYTPWHNTAAKQKALANDEKTYNCLGGDPLTSYLNSAVVKEALHISNSSNVWSDCSNIDYTILQKGSLWIYEELKGQIKMLHYSGDQDGCVPTQGTLEWIDHLNRAEVAPWKAYNEAGTAGEAAKQVGGYFWQLDGLDFGTVHGAGHMCPMDQPKRSYQLIINWMLGNPIDPNWTTEQEEDKFI